MADTESMFKRKRKNFRKRRHSSSSNSDSEKEDDLISKLDDAKELQKLRNKAHGVSAASLALGKKLQKTEEVLVGNDPFKLKTGGYIDMKALKAKGTRLSTEEAEAIGTAFAAETNRRDEDADMLKYVEEELAKRKGVSSVKDETQKQNIAEDALYELPEHLQVRSSKKTEGMLSNQMLSGIPEVDLGIEAKIRNIEATEEAKQRLIQERMRMKEKVSDFVPTNMAVNFVQHNRFNIEDTAPLLKVTSKESPKPKPLRVGDSEIVLETAPENKKKPKDNATDDYHYDKFKKHMMRRN